MKKLNAIILVLTMTLAVSAKGQTSQAKDLYAGKCAMCHGADGTANSSIGKSLKIPSFHSTDVQNLTDADLKTMIAKGKGAMPTFTGKLSDSQIDQMVVYIRTLGKK